MASEPQRCAAWVPIGGGPGGRGAIEAGQCNLPIEGYGPCAYMDEVDLGEYEPCDRAPEEHPINGTWLHPYQPSQWRHVKQPATDFDARVLGHEATPGEQVKAR